MNTNQNKLDAYVKFALDDKETKQLHILIQINEPASAYQEELKNCGLKISSFMGDIIAGVISKENLLKLSDLDIVKRIALSKMLYQDNIL